MSSARRHQHVALEPPDRPDGTTEIHVAPDGRVYLFGASAAVLEAMAAAGIGNDALSRRLAQILEAPSKQPARKSRVNE